MFFGKEKTCIPDNMILIQLQRSSVVIQNTMCFSPDFQELLLLFTVGIFLNSKYYDINSNIILLKIN